MNEYIPKWLAVFLGCLLVVFLGLSAIEKTQNLTERFSGKDPKNTLTVSAEGKVKAVPDVAMVNLGVVTQGATSAIVQDENSKKINKIIDFVKQQGVSRDDISTAQFNIYPQYNYKDGRNEIIGYEARQNISIKVKGVDKTTDALGKILSGSTTVGANEIGGVSLSFEDKDNLRQMARKEAIEKAKTKATELAKVSGLKLGRVITVSESGQDSMPMPYYAGGMGGGGSDVAKSVSPNVEPGTQDVYETMTLVFELK
jgi:uncharacterized protein